jgi:hypothetical protein
MPLLKLSLEHTGQLFVTLHPTTFLQSDEMAHCRLSCRVCGVCKHEIGHGHYLSCMGMYWHPQCFRCSACGHAIHETEVTILHFLFSKKCASVSSESDHALFLLPVRQFTLVGADPYHKLCYKELHHPKCDVCLQFVRLSLKPLTELGRASTDTLALPFKWLPLQ